MIIFLDQSIRILRTDNHIIFAPSTRMSRPITVHLCDPHSGTTAIAVRSDDPVSVLLHHVHGSGRTQLFYKDTLIIPAFSFAYFGIDDGSKVSVLHCNEPRRHERPDYFKHNMKKRRQLEAQKAQSSFPALRLLRRLANRELLAEIARLGDVSMHMQEKEGSVHPMSSKNQHPGAVGVSNDFVPNEFVTADARRPSTDALPMLWK